MIWNDKFWLEESLCDCFWKRSPKTTSSLKVALVELAESHVIVKRVRFGLKFKLWMYWRKEFWISIDVIIRIATKKSSVGANSSVAQNAPIKRFRSFVCYFITLWKRAWIRRTQLFQLTWKVKWLKKWKGTISPESDIGQFFHVEAVKAAIRYSDLYFILYF